VQCGLHNHHHHHKHIIILRNTPRIYTHTTVS
jgi:hypothetical protein